MQRLQEKMQAPVIPHRYRAERFHAFIRRANVSNSTKGQRFVDQHLEKAGLPFLREMQEHNDGALDELEIPVEKLAPYYLSLLSAKPGDAAFIDIGVQSQVEEQMALRKTPDYHNRLLDLQMKIASAMIVAARNQQASQARGC